MFLSPSKLNTKNDSKRLYSRHSRRNKRRVTWHRRHFYISPYLYPGTWHVIKYFSCFVACLVHILVGLPVLSFLSFPGSVPLLFKCATFKNITSTWGAGCVLIKRVKTATCTTRNVANSKVPQFFFTRRTCVWTDKILGYFGYSIKISTIATL